MLHAPARGSCIAWVVMPPFTWLLFRAREVSVEHADACCRHELGTRGMCMCAAGGHTGGGVQSDPRKALDALRERAVVVGGGGLGTSDDALNLLHRGTYATHTL